LVFGCLDFVTYFTNVQQSESQYIDKPIILIIFEKQGLKFLGRSVLLFALLSRCKIGIRARSNQVYFAITVQIALVVKRLGSHAKH